MNKPSSLHISLFLMLIVFGGKSFSWGGNPAKKSKNDTEMTQNNLTTAQQTEQAQVLLREGVDDLLYNLVPPTYDNNPMKLPEACQLKVRFNMKIKGLTVVFANHSTGDYTDIEWTWGDGYLSQAKDKVTHTYEKPGLYSFSVLAYDKSSGCIDVFTGNYYLFDPNAPVLEEMQYVSKDKALPATPETSIKNDNKLMNEQIDNQMKNANVIKNEDKNELLHENVRTAHFDADAIDESYLLSEIAEMETNLLVYLKNE